MYITLTSNSVKFRLKGVNDDNYNEVESFAVTPSIADGDILIMKLSYYNGVFDAKYFDTEKPIRTLAYEFMIDRSNRSLPDSPTVILYDRESHPLFPKSGSWILHSSSRLDSLWFSGQGIGDYTPLTFPILFSIQGIASALELSFYDYTDIVLSQALFESNGTGSSVLSDIHPAVNRINQSVRSLIPLPNQLVPSNIVPIFEKLPDLVTSSSTIYNIVNSGRLTSGAIDIQITNYIQFALIPRLERLEGIVFSLTGVINPSSSRKSKNYDITSIFDYTNSVFPSPDGFYFLPFHLLKDPPNVKTFLFNGITIKTTDSDSIDIKRHTIILAPNQPDLFSKEDVYRDYSQNFSEYGTALFKMFNFSFKGIKLIYLKMAKIPPCYLPYIVYSLEDEVCMV